MFCRRSWHPAASSKPEDENMQMFEVDTFFGPVSSAFQDGVCCLHRPTVSQVKLFGRGAFHLHFGRGPLYRACFLGYYGCRPRFFQTAVHFWVNGCRRRFLKTIVHFWVSGCRRRFPKVDTRKVDTRNVDARKVDARKVDNTLGQQFGFGVLSFQGPGNDALGQQFGCGVLSFRGPGNDVLGSK